MTVQIYKSDRQNCWISFNCLVLLMVTASPLYPRWRLRSIHCYLQAFSPLYKASWFLYDDLDVGVCLFPLVLHFFFLTSGSTRRCLHVPLFYPFLESLSVAVDRDFNEFIDSLWLGGILCYHLVEVLRVVVLCFVCQTHFQFFLLLRKVLNLSLVKILQFWLSRRAASSSHSALAVIVLPCSWSPCYLEEDCLTT